jgi:ABC-2 type transport system permease protein
MNRLQTVFSHELKTNFSRKGFLFTTFGVPILLLVLLFGYDFYQQNLAASPEEQQEQQQTLAEELNLDGIQQAGLVDLSGTLNETPPELASVIVRYDSIDAAREALQANELDLFYVVSEDFIESGDVTAHVPGLQITLFNDRIPEAIFYENAGDNLEATLERRLRNPLSLTEINLERTETAGQEQNEDADFFIIYVFTLGLLMPVFVTNGYLMQSVLEEKENKLVEILISTVTPVQLLGGKILALGLMGLFQVGIWTAGGVLAYVVAQSLPTYQGLSVIQMFQFPTHLLPLMLAYFVLTYFMFAAFYSTIGAITNSMSEGPQYATILVLPSMIPFWFISLFLEAPNAAGPVIMSIFPLTAPLAMVMRVLLVPVPFWQIALSLGLLLLVVIAAIWIAGRSFRVQMLLSGQTPDLREIPALLFSDRTPQQTEQSAG